VAHLRREVAKDPLFLLLEASASFLFRSRATSKSIDYSSSFALFPSINDNTTSIRLQPSFVQLLRLRVASYRRHDRDAVLLSQPERPTRFVYPSPTAPRPPFAYDSSAYCCNSTSHHRQIRHKSRVEICWFVHCVKEHCIPALLDRSRRE